MKKMWLPIFLSVLSGLLLTAGFPKLELFFLSWVALIPLFVALQEKTWKQALLLGYLCGIVHYATTLYWIYYVIGHYGGLPAPLSVGVLLILCGYLAIYPAGFALVAHRWKACPLLWTFGLPAVWVSLEWIRAHAVTGFPWANLGYTQTPFASLVQFADITGVYGVSWLVVFGNTVIMAVMNRTRVWTSVAALVLCFCVAVSYGSWRIAMIKGLQEQASPWTVGVAQGNIDQSQKWDPAFQQETLRRYRELSLKATSHNPLPDMLVWPETSVPFFYGIEDKLTSQLNGILREIGTPLVFGSPAVTIAGGRTRLQNRAYLVDGKGVLSGSYAKQHLVPFGEYVPYRSVLFFVDKLVEFAGDFVSGNDPSPLSLNGRQFGVLICYEGIFPDISRQAVRRGATALINITNDAWYGPTSAPYQHLQISRWRAMEFRVPLIRAANTGVSAIFDATGASYGSIPLDVEGQMVATVRPIRLLTFYAKWGDLFAWICVFAAFGGILYSSIKR